MARSKYWNLKIRNEKRYLKYLKKHLEKEHPKTKGKITI
jgi:hypothetical protein